jgi:hypothetical protein
MALDGSGISRRSSMALDGSGISRAPPQSRIELVLSLDELPRLGFLPLIFCNKLKMTRRRLDNSFFARMKGVPEFVGPHGTEG